MRQVMGVYAQQASARLAKHNLQAKVLTAFAATSHYNRADSSYPSVCVPLPMPTTDPLLLVRAAYALPPLIVDGVKYVRDGNCSAGGGEPRIAGKEVIEGVQSILALLPRCSHVGAHGQERFSALW